MMLNIEGYKKFVRKCRKQATYIVIIYRFYVKVEMTILYMKLL